MLDYIKARLGLGHVGQPLAEYALILVLVTVVTTIELGTLGGGVVQQLGQSAIGR